MDDNKLPDHQDKAWDKLHEDIRDVIGKHKQDNPAFHPYMTVLSAITAITTVIMDIPNEEQREDVIKNLRKEIPMMLRDTADQAKQMWSDGVVFVTYVPNSPFQIVGRRHPKTSELHPEDVVRPPPGADALEDLRAWQRRSPIEIVTGKEAEQLVSAYAKAMSLAGGSPAQPTRH